MPLCQRDACLNEAARVITAIAGDCAAITRRYHGDDTRLLKGLPEVLNHPSYTALSRYTRLLKGLPEVLLDGDRDADARVADGEAERAGGEAGGDGDGADLPGVEVEEEVRDTWCGEGVSCAVPAST